MLDKTPKRAHARANKKFDRPPFAPGTRIAIENIRARVEADKANPPKPKYKRLLDSKFSAERKTFPITTGFLDYFPDAVAAGSEVSFLGNQKHNPGQALHHARGKSSDHADCIGRHLIQRGGFEDITIDGVVYKVRHSAALFWRAGAMLQEELEADKGYALPRGASVKE